MIPKDREELACLVELHDLLEQVGCGFSEFVVVVAWGSSIEIEFSISTCEQYGIDS